MKLDPSGVTQWRKTYGGSSLSYAHSIFQTADGGYIVSGATSTNDGDFAGLNQFSNPVPTMYLSQQYENACWLKINSTGDIVWKKVLGGEESERCLWTEPTRDGGFVAVSHIWVPYGTPANDRTTWVTKHDANGDLVWQKYIGGYTPVGYVLSFTPNLYYRYNGGQCIRETPDNGFVVYGLAFREGQDVCGMFPSIYTPRDLWLCKLGPNPKNPPEIAGELALTCGAPTTTLTVRDTSYQAITGYLWDSGATTQAVTVGVGTYTVTVTYENRCTRSLTAAVTLGGGLTFNPPTVVPQLCTKGGSFSVTANNGTAPYIYQNSQGTLTNTLSALPAATYTVTATDNNGCTGSTQIVVSSRTDTILPTLTAAQPRCATQTGSIAAAPQGGTAPYSILPTTLIGLSPNTYTVSVTDANGCTATATQIINAAPALLTAALTTQNGTCGQANASISVAPQGGTAPYIILPTTLIGLSPNTYTVSVTDANGCATTATAVLTATPPITATLTATTPLCRDEPTGSIRVSNIQNAVAPVGFAVDNGSFTPINPIQNISAGLHTARLLDASGCDWQDTIRLANPPLLTVSIGRDTSVQLGDSLRFTATVTGAAPAAAVQYAWSCGAGGSQPTLWLQAKNNEKCTVTVTDANGCTATATRQISIKDATAVYIPTAFSPNDDGNNDDFAIYGGVSVVAIKVVRIFDRWGELVYEAFDRAPNTALWNGNWSAHSNVNSQNTDLQKAIIDVYVYYTEIELIDGSVRRFTGDVTVLR